jgi:hypothetical protein
VEYPIQEVFCQVHRRFILYLRAVGIVSAYSFALSYTVGVSGSLGCLATLLPLPQVQERASATPFRALPVALVESGTT